MTALPAFGFNLAWFNPVIAFAAGILLSWKLRKIFARVQLRGGPLLWLPGRWRDINRSKVLQPLYDIQKLFSKQTIIPHTATPLFYWGPILALACAVMSAWLVPIAGVAIDYSFSSVVLFYLLFGVLLFIIVGGTTSASLFAAIGSVREIELMLANEIPFILSMFSLAIMYDTLSINGMMGFNLLYNPFAAVAMFIAIMVKLHIKPFDISEAESEIVGGMTTEYSGKLLGVLEVIKVISVFVLLALFADLFLWVPATGLAAVAVFVVGVVATGVSIGLVNALFARFRIDQATSWLFRFSTIIAIAGVGLALLWRMVL